MDVRPRQVPQSEADLLVGLRAGDEAAFAELVRQHTPRLLAVARRLLNQEQDAQDAVQDAFLSAFRGLASFDANSRLATWLHRITVNAALMKLRSKRRQPEQPIDPLLPTYLADGHRHHPGPAWRALPTEALVQAETRELVRRCIAQLPDSYRVVLVLRDIEALDTQTVADHLGIEAGAVKTRLHRARQALRTLLDPHFRGESA
ncbi:MAG: sigma-70 family RNA polymerase sigma factor [Pirellulales bacterium]|nr:sigma-70 family RNA polymerase sigma factor [Pirellulales bacterium]